MQLKKYFKEKKLRVIEKDFHTENIIRGYELLDCGDGRKLERFGEVVLIRPEPNAWGKAGFSEREWEDLADFEFIEKNKTSGKWIQLGENIPDDWHLIFTYKNRQIKFKLKLTAFKHVGIFPEQAVNWTFIYDQVTQSKLVQPKILNLFAYTGGASLIAKAAGAEVTHVDSIKQVVTWANENQSLSNLSDIRWIVEDARKYVQRELKRGKTYNGIIMDPPAFGHGPKGQKWILERDLQPLLEDTFKLLSPQSSFLLLNVYATGFDMNYLKQIADKIKPELNSIQIGDLYSSSKSQKRFCSGSMLRLVK